MYGFISKYIRQTTARRGTGRQPEPLIASVNQLHIWFSGDTTRSHPVWHLCF